MENISEQQKLQMFSNEINDIKNDLLREFAIQLILNAPQYFFIVPASSSGKYHPYFAREKGCPISLNGEIPTFEVTMKDVRDYNAYKEKRLIEIACKWLREQKEIIGISFQEDFIERFKMEMNKYTN